jgi:hypothetical protein
MENFYGYLTSSPHRPDHPNDIGQVDPGLPKSSNPVAVANASSGSHLFATQASSAPFFPGRDRSHRTTLFWRLSLTKRRKKLSPRVHTEVPQKPAQQDKNLEKSKLEKNSEIFPPTERGKLRRMASRNSFLNRDA